MNETNELPSEPGKVTGQFPPEFINADGFVTILPNSPHIPGEGNGFLHTGLAFACGMYTPPENLIDRCRKSPECPLIWRSPWKKNPDDSQEHDDYYGALLLNAAWAKELLEYAERSGWDFAIQDRDRGNIRYNFSRFPGFVPLLRVCAGKRLSLWDKIILTCAIVYSAFAISDADTNKKSFCLIRGTAPGGLLEAFWKRQIRKRYGTIGKSWAASFPVQHPLQDYD